MTSTLAHTPTPSDNPMLCRRALQVPSSVFSVVLGARVLRPR